MSETAHEDREALFDRLRIANLPAAAPNAADPSVVLNTPMLIARGGIVVPLDFALPGLTSVTILPPTFGDVEAVVDGSKSELEMHASMTGLSVETFRSLRWPDAEKIVVAARHLAPELKSR